MNDKNYLAMAIATAKRKKLAHTTPQEYALPIWMMFIAADILENSAMEIQGLLMQDEQFIQSDKMHIKAIINHAGKFVMLIGHVNTSSLANLRTIQKNVPLYFAATCKIS